ncbi:DNA-binding response regulator [Streptomyces pluripotens]|uniref:DNA-binding response regulator n=1 Tax=Streptomyces pluripotens TaxID=1355015 RepID=A0A221P1I6_9ACTN|nr:MULTISPECIES: response regulator transcription factor [Streptomyces]ARP71694.1 DNA-binding response regulator [Streptomyces pluripotens]ASN25946.1 DNA-binding response regulator [Streptomyces pluripotens]KIE25726.1 transcriptional regulator [Streptomyces sp. MUSC 125]MCH0557633.1 response regulator transcription factor [Streptomyces sp. MUM 16J]
MHYLVVDDETRLTDLVVRYLTESGHTAQGRYDGISGLAAARDPRLDGIVLDVMLPGMDGVEVCRTLRNAGVDVPVILLTARGAISERVAGLDAGADDYLVKPFAMEELLARLRAISRRRPDCSGRLRVSDLVLDPGQQRAWRGDTELDLSRREFAVLRVLMENAGQVVTRLHLLDEVWDGETDLRSNAIDVHVSKVRAKVDRAFGRTTITTLRGRGYRLETSS